MFKNEYQGGPCVEVFSAQGKDGKHSQWKLTGSGIKKVFDKEVKSSIFTLEGTTSATKIQLPKEVKQTLSLTQGILVLQIYVPQGHDVALELGVLDSADQKCRLAFSTAFKETQVTALHVKIPLALIKRAVWLNLCIDLRSLVRDNLKSSSYKSLESICVSGNCKLRRIFTMRNQAPDTTNDDELYGIADMNAEVELETIPKQCQLAADVHQLTQVINFMKLQYYEGKGKQPEPPSTSRSGLIRDADLLSSGSVADGQVAYHIAFGSKVPVPSRRAPLKEGNATSRPALLRQNSGVSAESSQIGHNDGARCPQEEELGSGTVSKKLESEVKPAELAFPADRSSDQLKTSHAWTVDITASDADGEQDEAIVVVKPHPPRKPSSEKARRRRPRVKSTSNDPIPAVNSSDGVLSSGSSESQKVGSIALKKDEEKYFRVSKPPSNPTDMASDESDTDSSDSMEYNELIKNLNKNKIDDGDKENLNNGNKVYVFSSRPMCIDMARTRPKHPRKKGMASAPSRKMHDSELKPNNIRRPVSETTPRSSGAVAADASYDQDFELSDISNLDSFKQSPEPRVSVKDQRVNGRNGDVQSSTKSQTRKSINRKSLREIPVEELQRSGGQKPYSFAKYQMGEVTESFEQQMLLSMQRADAATEAAESEDEQPSTHLPLGYEAMTDSSDDLSTHKSPKMLKNRSHNYQDEISNLGQNFMTHSNPRDWAEVFSPPIVLPSHGDSRQTKNTEKALHTTTSKGSEDREKRPNEEADTDEELDLLYDPELHYFYDPHTTKYYELITPGSNPKANAMLSRQ